MAKAKYDASAEITKYIKGLAPFAKVICEKLRSVILSASPDIEEQWKWGPHYYSNGMVCGFAGFQKHVKITFFNGSGMKDPKKLFNHCVDNEFSRSIKFTDISEVNEKLLASYVKESVAINKLGFKRIVLNKTVTMPEDFKAALAKNEKAERFFNNLSYGYKKEGVEWVETAKKEETRRDRIQKLVDMHALGLRMNDKYRK